ARKQLYPPGDMRYTGLELWGLSLRIMRIKCLFLIQPLRKAKAAVRHVVFGMVWTSRKQVRHKSVAANVKHWVTTTRSVLRMHFTMLLTSVLPEIPEMEHLLRSDDHRRELLVEGIRCHDPQLYRTYLYSNRASSLYGTYMYLYINHASSLYRIYL